jgi:hypothetical protein
MSWIKMGRGQDHRSAVIQAVHNRYYDSVAMKQWIIHANAAVVFVELLSLS